MKAVSVLAEKRPRRADRLEGAVATPTGPKFCVVVTNPSMREVGRVITAS
jgi:hypothetical protein